MIFSTTTPLTSEVKARPTSRRRIKLKDSIITIFE